MAVPVTLSSPAAGAGNRFYEDLQKLGRLQPKLCQTSPAKLFAHKRLPCKCFWQLPRSKNTSRGLLRLRLAQGKEAEDGFIPNVSEDTDDMFDDLFDRYGKVVYSRKDKKPPSAELDDDAESLSFAVELAKVANEVKAGDIKVLFVKPLVYWTRFFIIVTAFSRPQIDAIGSKMRDLAEKKYGKIPTGDSKPNSWTLLDFGDVVIHIFLPPQRAFYNLEEFYGNATAIELPFENEVTNARLRKAYFPNRDALIGWLMLLPQLCQLRILHQQTCLQTDGVLLKSLVIWNDQLSVMAQ